jgi:hypothetical protein
LNIITSTNKTNAVFLAIVLLTGTIAAISPSFITGANAQAQPYYGMDSRPNSYGPSQYSDRNDYYDSYESDYGMDNDDRKSYGNDNGYDKPQYQHPTYKSDYKPKYPSYGEKDERGYKSHKDNSKNVEINKFNCINTNININGNNTGDINLGNRGQGYSGANENANGEGEANNGEGYYYDGQNYKNDGEGFDCVINNNNTNINLVIGGDAGNVTDGNVTEPQTCEECFEKFLTPIQISAYLTAFNPTSPPTLTQFCNEVAPGSILDLSESGFRASLAGAADVEFDVINALIVCLKSVGVEFSP